MLLVCGFVARLAAPCFLPWSGVAICNEPPWALMLSFKLDAFGIRLSPLIPRSVLSRRSNASDFIHIAIFSCPPCLPLTILRSHWYIRFLEYLSRHNIPRMINHQPYYGLRILEFSTGVHLVSPHFHLLLLAGLLSLRLDLIRCFRGWGIVSRFFIGAYEMIRFWFDELLSFTK